VALTSIEVGVCVSHRGKIPYHSRREAWKVAKRMIAVGNKGNGLETYVCASCGWWFIGSSLPRQVKLKLRRQGRLRASSS
jgi:hypothetical protein